MCVTAAVPVVQQYEQPNSAHPVREIFLEWSIILGPTAKLYASSSNVLSERLADPFPAMRVLLGSTGLWRRAGQRRLTIHNRLTSSSKRRESVIRAARRWAFQSFPSCRHNCFTVSHKAYFERWIGVGLLACWEACGLWEFIVSATPTAQHRLSPSFPRQLSPLDTRHPCKRGYNAFVVNRKRSTCTLCANQSKKREERNTQKRCFGCSTAA